MSSKANNLTTSEKIAEIFMPEGLADPEIDQVDKNLVKIADFDEDALDIDHSLSDIRKRNTKPLSEISGRYKGKVYSRSQFENSTTSGSENYTEDDSDEDSGEEDENNSDFEQEPKRKKPNEENLTLVMSDGPDEDELLNINSKVSNQEEIEKGLAVQHQLKLWEKLLEVRIHVQKMIIKANSLPLPEPFNKLLNADARFSNTVAELTKNLQALIEGMLDMQYNLGEQYTATKKLFKSERKRSHKSNTNEAVVNELSTRLSSEFQSFTPYRNAVLQKWDDRTKVLRPGASIRERNKSQAATSDLMSIIETILLNKTDLIAKSHIVKGNYQLFGTKLSAVVPNATDNDTNISNESTTSCEIYDDTDFYHQQLRELIEFKSNTNSNPAEIMTQFTELQKLRNKMKKTVDMRASKGRKIRYVVHNKLVNFMAPNQHSDWTDDSKSELYRSLFAT